MAEDLFDYTSMRKRRAAEGGYLDAVRRGRSVDPYLTSTFGDIFSDRRNIRGSPLFVGPNASPAAPWGERQGERLDRRDVIGDPIAGPSGRLGDPEGYDRPRRLFGGGATPTELGSLGYNPAEFGSRPVQSFALPSGGFASVGSRVSGQEMADYFNRPSSGAPPSQAGQAFKFLGQRNPLQNLASQAQAAARTFKPPQP